MSTDEKCDGCTDPNCDGNSRRPGEKERDFEERRALAARLCEIEHTIIVLSGKGGVGKSTVAVNVAVSLALAGKRVGLLDIDIHGPSVPKLLGLEDVSAPRGTASLSPVHIGFGKGLLNVMSIGFLLSNRDEAVIWRGPAKHNVIKQFLKDVEWGRLHYLVVDAPPGTGDEPLTIVQLIDKADGAIVVTTPQDVAVQDVRRSIRFCQKLSLPVLGVVENMSGFVCPHCHQSTSIFKAGGGEQMARDLGVPFLGAIPIEPEIMAGGDGGEPIVRKAPHSEAAHAFGRIVRPFLVAPQTESTAPVPAPSINGRTIIAVPVAAGALCLHFGHCDSFELFEVDLAKKVIVGRNTLAPPAHEPGVLPRWLADQKTQVVIAGGLGARAQSLLAESGIAVVTGAPATDPECVVMDYLRGELHTSENVCDH